MLSMSRLAKYLTLDKVQMGWGWLDIWQREKFNKCSHLWKPNKELTNEKSNRELVNGKPNKELTYRKSSRELVDKKFNRKLVDGKSKKY